MKSCVKCVVHLNMFFLLMLFQKIEKEARKEVDEAAQKAKVDPELPLSELYTNIYSQNPENFEIRGCDAFSSVTAQ